MKYEVTFSCGHTGTVQLYGKGDERERKIRYFEEYGVCSACKQEHCFSISAVHQRRVSWRKPFQQCS